MNPRKIFFNALLACAVALPLAAFESRAIFHVSGESFPLETSASLSAPDPFPLSFSEPELVDLVSGKLSSPEDPAHHDQYDTYIARISRSYGVSPALVKAVIRAESNFNAKAVSPAGAVGLMQVLPQTANRLGVTDPYDPQKNILAGVKYLKKLLDMFDGDELLALAAYNSGPARVQKHKGIPPIRETRVFVAKVMAYYHSYMRS
jgi:soluble lytic murein transglycosylase-like protein